MRLTLELPTDVSVALVGFAARIDAPIEFAAVEAIRDWLIGTGYLEIPDDLDEDSETEGGA